MEQKVQKEKLQAESRSFDCAGHGIITGIKVSMKKKEADLSER